MMKKCLLIVVALLFLTGCAAQDVFETVSDVYGEESLQPKQIQLELPEGADSAITGSNGTLYLCDNYEITVQTLSGGDLNATFRLLTGFPLDSLTVVQTVQTGMERYECVWTAAGEGGDSVGRAVVLDDGSFHYCVTVMTASENAGKLQESWQDFMSSVRTG